MKVAEALNDIRQLNLVLPEFQREYVWTLDQAKQLMASLVRGWPVGGILIWKTDHPPELKNVKALPDKIGTVSVLLDGQQRLTTLNMLIEGQIPRYYQPEEIENDPRSLCVNLETLEFQYQQSKMAADPRWRLVTECFDPTKAMTVVQAASEISGGDAGRLTLLMSNLTALKNIVNVDLPEQVVPSNATLTEAITIFDRINSQGTKLTDAELALTHVTAKWPQARRVFKSKIDDLRKGGFEFDLTFMTRALTVAVTGRALFREIHESQQPQLLDGWKKLTKVLDYLVTFLPQGAHINSNLDLNTTNALIPLVAYLCRAGGKFPDDEAMKHATNWLHTALIWARYTSQTDQRLEADIGLIARELSPWDALRAQIVEQRGRIKVEPADLAGRGVLNPLYRATFALVKAYDARDWFNGLPLRQPHGQSYKLHSHHIFPQALLYRSGYDPTNATHKQLINEIANRAFLTADSNLATSDTAPSVYFPKVETKFPGTLAAQFIPMDPALWEVDRYEDFLAARRKLIATKLNEFLAGLITKPEPLGHRPVIELIALGESYTLEFKSSWQWDMRLKEVNKQLRQSCLKTVAAFLNSDGGTLLIGVEDDGNVVGLDRDIAAAQGSLDRLEQQIIQAVIDAMGTNAATNLRLRFEELSAGLVCVIEVEPSPEQVYSKTEKGQEFFCRLSNTTRSLTMEEAQSYIQSHWT